MLKGNNLKKKFRHLKQIINEKTGKYDKIKRSALYEKDLTEISLEYEYIKLVIIKIINYQSFQVDESYVINEKKHNYFGELGQVIVSNSKDVNTLVEELLILCGHSLIALNAESLNLSYLLKENQNYISQNILQNHITPINKIIKDLSIARLDLDSSMYKIENYKRSKPLIKRSKSFIHANQDKLVAMENELHVNSENFSNLRDTFTYQILGFYSRYSIISGDYVNYMEELYRHHCDCKAILEQQKVALDEVLSKYTFKPIFGISLEDQYKEFKSEISPVIKTVLEFLYNNDCFSCEGIFRIGSNAKIVKSLKNRFDSGDYTMTIDTVDLHTATGCLKLYLNELPEPLFTFTLVNKWLEVNNYKDQETRKTKILPIVAKLPKLYKKNLFYLLSFLHVLTHYAAETKMNAYNFAVVFAPNFMQSDDETKAMSYSQAGITVLTDLIVNFVDWFPNEFEKCDYINDDVRLRLLSRATKSQVDRPSISLINMNKTTRRNAVDKMEGYYSCRIRTNKSSVVSTENEEIEKMDHVTYTKSDEIESKVIDENINELTSSEKNILASMQSLKGDKEIYKSKSSDDHFENQEKETESDEKGCISNDEPIKNNQFENEIKYNQENVDIQQEDNETEYYQVGKDDSQTSSDDDQNMFENEYYQIKSEYSSTSTTGSLKKTESDSESSG